MKELKKTALYDLHRSLGAKSIPFAGYEMPVNYPLGIMKEHLYCRESAGLFDVSHMGQILIENKESYLDKLEKYNYMNLMLTASCNDADDFKINGYEKLKSEFSEWCDSSKCIFCKIIKIY